jgi:hypothetical protein
MALGIATIASHQQSGGAVALTPIESGDVSWSREDGGFIYHCGTERQSQDLLDANYLCHWDGGTCTLHNGQTGREIVCPGDELMDALAAGEQAVQREQRTIVAGKVSSAADAVVKGIQDAMGYSPVTNENNTETVTVQQAGVGPALPWIVGAVGVVGLFGGLLVWHFWPEKR